MKDFKFKQYNHFDETDCLVMLIICMLGRFNGLATYFGNGII